LDPSVVLQMNTIKNIKERVVKRNN